MGPLNSWHLEKGWCPLYLPGILGKSEVNEGNKIEALLTCVPTYLQQMQMSPIIL